MRVWERCKKVVNFPGLIAGAIASTSLLFVQESFKHEVHKVFQGLPS